jgi:hypothetical protein
MDGAGRTTYLDMGWALGAIPMDVRNAIRAEIARFQLMLTDADASSARALPGSKDYKAAAISHWKQMIGQRQGLLSIIG